MRAPLLARRAPLREAEPRADALELRLPGHAVDVALQDLALRRALLGDLGLVGRRLDEEGLVVLAGFNIVLDRVADVRVLVHGQLLLARVVVLRPLPDEVPRDGLSRQKVEHADARVAVRPLELLRREVGAELELPQREHEFIGRRRRVVELVHGKRFTVARRALHEPAAELEEERELHRRVRPRRRELPARDGLLVARPGEVARAVQELELVVDVLHDHVRVAGRERRFFRAATPLARALRRALVVTLHRVVEARGHRSDPGSGWWRGGRERPPRQRDSGGAHAQSDQNSERGRSLGRCAPNPAARAAGFAKLSRYRYDGFLAPHPARTCALLKPFGFGFGFYGRAPPPPPPSLA